MCEFDFSDFLSPTGALDFYTYTTIDKPFYPFFKIKVGWVNQEEVSLQDAADLKTIGLFSGLANIVGNRINNFIQGASRLPGQLIGSVLNPLKSALESEVFGSAYEGVASDITYDPDKPGKIPPLMSPTSENRPVADRPIPYDTEILSGTSIVDTTSGTSGSRFNGLLPSLSGDILTGKAEAYDLTSLPNVPYTAEILAGKADTYLDSNEAYPGPRKGPPNRFNPNPPVENIYDAAVLAGKSTAYDLST